MVAYIVIYKITKVKNTEVTFVIFYMCLAYILDKYTKK